MPKKAHGRPAKARSRARRTPPPPRPYDMPTTTALENRVAPNGAAGAPIAETVAVPRPPRRRSAAPVAITSVNYHYLRRDITTLAVLGPTMVILLVLAFLFLH